MNTDNANVDPGIPLAPLRMILFIAGGEANSLRAKENLDRLCVEEPEFKCELEIIDVLSDFQSAMEHNVMVTPTLIVTEPLPGITILGDLRDTERLRAAFRL